MDNTMHGFDNQVFVLSETKRSNYEDKNACNEDITRENKVLDVNDLLLNGRKVDTFDSTILRFEGFMYRSFDERRRANMKDLLAQGKL
ncbi:unnamed protein product [Leptosia nina]|uniref:Uncharacterized protein n=1 Tax=Leptosia nina TaxID=320188 RepID=A0AAV1JC47_9NEOP